MAVKEKTVVTMTMNATGETHARSKIGARDVSSVIDEPTERGGTNAGLTPTETLMASLLGCTNVITKRIAHTMGVEMGEMHVDLAAQFDRRGVQLAEEVDVPFQTVTLTIDVATDATPEQMEVIKADLQKFCPIAKVIRASGTTIHEHWTTRPL